MSTQDLVIGIDSSTTACKAIAWDSSGQVIAESRAAYPTESPQPNWYEQNAEDWWTALCHVLHDVAARVGSERIAALCITNQRETFVPVNSAGKPLRSAILWNDERCRAQVAELDRLIGNEAIHALTGKGPSTTQVLPELLWLKAHEPDIFDRAYKFVEAHAFLVYHLTGRWVTALPCADPTGLVDMHQGTWASDLLNRLDIDPDWFVEIIDAGDIAGEITTAAAAVTGLQAGTPVVAGSGDGQCAGLGANVTQANRAYLNLGTAVVSGAFSESYVYDRAFRTMCSPVAGAFVPEGVLNSGTFVVNWFVQQFGPDVRHLGLPLSPEEVLEVAARKLPPGALGLMLVPYWSGVMPPYWDPAASGITIGWRGAHRREHFYRAVLEGIAYEHRLGMTRIEAATGTAIDEYVLMGGGSRSDLWCQIISDVSNKPATRAHTAEASNLGAAILAAAAAGWYPDVRSAANAMTTTGRGFEPDPAAHAIYDELFNEVYVHLFPAIQPFIDKLTALTERA